MLLQTRPYTDSDSLDQFEKYTWLVVDTSPPMDGIMSPYPLSTFMGQNQYICIFMTRKGAEELQGQLDSPFYRILEFSAPYGPHQMVGMWLSMIEEVDANGVMIIHGNGYHWLVPTRNLELWYNVASGHAVGKAAERKMSELRTSGSWLQYARTL